MQRVVTTWLSLPIFPGQHPHTHTISPTPKTRGTAHRTWLILRLEQLLGISLGENLISQHPDTLFKSCQQSPVTTETEALFCIARTRQHIHGCLSKELDYLTHLGSTGNAEGPIGTRVCLSESVGSRSEHRQLPIAPQRWSVGISMGVMVETRRPGLWGGPNWSWTPLRGSF